MGSLVASQIFDSRGNPTIRVVLTTKGHRQFEAQVPSGASKGSYEALEVRDGGKEYNGCGVSKAVASVNDVIAPILMQKINANQLSLADQAGIDTFLCQLDGTKNKEHLGANAILGVSMACARAGAHEKSVELFEHLASLSGMPTDDYVLPVPFMNQINGGVHSGNTLAPQEFMVAPIGAQTFQHAMRINTEIYHALKSIIAEDYGRSATGLGDEGGFAPPLKTADEALSLLGKACKKAGYVALFNSTENTGDVAFGVDPASQEFFDKETGIYDLGFKYEKPDPTAQLNGEALGELYRSMLRTHPIALLEDPFAEDDFVSWQAFMNHHPKHVEIVGDDLLATNPERIRIAIDQGLCNSLLLKINQIGTISEAIESAKLAMSHGWSVFVSHRSGETVDDFIADLTVGLRVGHLKAGAPARGERLAKYNRLLAIESYLMERGSVPRYAGRHFRTSHLM